MINLTQFAVFFVILWVTLYITVYNIILSESSSSQNVSITLGHSEGNLNHRGDSGGTLIIDPFVPLSCDSIQKSKSTSRIAKKSVAVVIPARNEKKEDLLRTVESLLLNSESYLKQVVIVDDDSTTPINAWKEWSTWKLAKQAKELVGAVTLPRRVGVPGAKAMGARLVIEKYRVDVIVFLDAHCIVSENWLRPLLQTLENNPKSLVYPMIDVIDPITGDLIQSDNVIGAFDWSFDFRWESPSASRTPLSNAVTAEDTCMSPSAPGIFAITSSFYQDIGGLHDGLRHYGYESIELSIRTWLCGGSVIRQPCSRVAHKYLNLHEDTALGTGVTQEVIDKNIMTIAAQWLSSTSHKETVFQSRFIGRVPYNVEVSIDASHPKFLQDSKYVSEDTCQDFDWYLKEVYPGLLQDADGVQYLFQKHIQSDYLTKALDPLLTQYMKKSSHAFDPNEIAKLIEQEKQAKLVLQQQQQQLKGNVIQKPESRQDVLSAYDQHIQRVHDELVCIDFIFNDGTESCELQAQKGICQKNPGYMLFACPKSCKLCDEQGKLCSDFYLKKCPEWKEEGQCETNADYMNVNCRKTCGRCTLGQAMSAESLNVAETPSKPKSDPKSLPKVATDSKLKNADKNSVEAQMPYYDPTVAQQLFRAGNLPDPALEHPCRLKGLEHGKLLDRIKLDRAEDLALLKDEPPPPKIFCGIYTMQNKHENNVKATRDTWGKRCNGFMAFSTTTDLSIPAIAIPHEGPEDYNNMWQKSRSIWKYIGSHYLDQFDWFLMGGDDMFYIIENLRLYLSSEEILKTQQESVGMFVGRRFFPPKQQVFNSGGAGYLLDKKALRVLMQNIDTPKCFPHQVGFWEDVNIANCLRVGGNILPFDTRDEFKRERFHPFTPGNHLGYRIPNNPDWYAQYNPELKVGFECCSERSVSFHYCPADLIRDLGSYVYHCPTKDPATI